MDVRSLLMKGLRQGHISFLTGAGISYSLPAGLPLGSQITQCVLDLVLLKSQVRRVFPADVIAKWKQLISQVPMELTWESLIRSTNEGVLSALTVLESGAPNKDHAAIALACKRFNIPTIFTLNFDLLQERALEAYAQVTPVSILSKEQFLRYRPQVMGRHPLGKVYVVHLHNALQSGNYGELTATVSKVGTGLPRYKRLSLSRFLLHNDIVCAGYSDGDPDVFPVIAGTPRKVFWYQFGRRERLPAGVMQAQESLEDRLLVVERQPYESGFSDLLCSLDSDIAATVEKIQHESGFRHPGPVLTAKDRLREIELALENCLGGTSSQQSQRSSLFLATILDELGQREDALEILKVGAASSKDQAMVYKENMLAGHAEERLGNIAKATRHFSVAQRNASREQEALEAQVEKASANLGTWKRSGYKIWSLLYWCCSIVSLSRTGVERIEQRRLWEIGDCANFVAEYLLVPSALVVWRLTEAPRRPLGLYTRDLISLLLLGPIRAFFLKLSARYYFAAIRLALKLDEDALPGYTGLAYLRSAEVIAALGKKRQATYLLAMAKRGGMFYEWLGSEHGIANATCASAVVNLYSGNFLLAESLFDLARRQYGSHLSGVLKCRIFSFRLVYWRKWLLDGHIPLIGELLGLALKM